MLARTGKIVFQGVAGAIDCALDLPMDTPRGWALVLHPHPLHGGARDNKIVTTIARACVQHGLIAVRPNFRGVGASAGEFDAAVGERSEEHTSELQSLMRISYAVFCLKKNTQHDTRI